MATYLHVILVCVSFISAQTLVSLSNCCPQGNYYVPYSDKCRDTNETTSSGPPISDSSANFSSLFNLSHDGTSAKCPEGFVVQAEAQFLLYSNGSVLVGDRVYESSEYCLAGGDPKDAEEAHNWYARFCAPDPCFDNRGRCVKKCCPPGFAIRTDDLRCVPDISDPFKPQFLGSDAQSLNFTIRYGVFPACEEGRAMLEPSVHKEDEFVLTADRGDLRHCPTPKERIVKDYCVEQIANRSHKEMGAVICYVNPTSGDHTLSLTIYPYVLFVSAFFTLSTVIVYLLVPELRNWHGKNVICHVFSLTVTYVLLGVVMLSAVVLHFFFVASFTWLNVLSFSIWWSFSTLKPKSTVNNARKERDRKRRFLMYSLYAWGVPLLLVVIGQILEGVAKPCSNLVVPGFGRVSCWFGDFDAMLYYLYFPIGIMIGTNIVLFIVTAFAYWEASKATCVAVRGRRLAQRFQVVLGLLLLMGVSWALEVVSFAVGGSSGRWVVPDIINILTGVFIFFMFVFKRKVGNQLKQHYGHYLDNIVRSLPKKSSLDAATTAQTTTQEAPT